MVISSVDIGTNTVLLLIAGTDPKNNKIIPLLNEYRIPRIGKNAASSGRISEESVERLIRVLMEYKEISAAYGSELFIAAATAAMRNARNSEEVINKVLDSTGVRIRIISGDEEAHYAYLGVTDGARDGKKRLIIDIGGGSSEIITGVDDKILYRKSFAAGVVTSSENFKRNTADLRNHFQKVFEELKIIEFKPDIAYAIAGTPTTIAAIKLGLEMFNEKMVEGSNLTVNDIESFVSDYENNQEFYVMRHKSILEGREDLMIPGSLILLRIMENLLIKSITVSTRGIRHGAIINYLLNQG